MPAWSRLRIVLVLSAFVAAAYSSTARATVTAGAGFVRTPWSRGSSEEKALTCGNCQFNSSGNVRNTWRTTGVGRYTVKFPGLAPVIGSRVVVHVTPLNTPGAHCTIASWGPSGSDYSVDVACRKTNVLFDTRFMLRVNVQHGTQTNQDKGFAGTFAGQLSLNHSWSSMGATPIYTKLGTGSYAFRFPDLVRTSVGGNAQVSSGTFGVHCRLASWRTFSGSGTEIRVRCQNAGLGDADANVFVSYDTTGAAWNGETSFAFANQHTLDGTYTPSSLYTVQMDPNAPITIQHFAALPGQYFIRFGGPTLRNANVFGQVTAWNGTSTCSFVELDERSARVTCLNQTTGQPQDNAFSLLAFNAQKTTFSGFAQVPVTGTNFKASSFDVGNGLICGEGAAGAFTNEVLCVAPSAPGSTTDIRPIGGGKIAGGGIKSIAIDNVDATQTNVLVLGGDNVVRITSGDLTQGWPSGTHFGSWSTHVQPVNTSGQSVTLKEITVVRSQGSTQTDVVALNTSGNLLSLTTNAGGTRVWGPVVFSLPAGKTYKHISHGRHDLYLLTTDNIMLRAVKNVGFGGLAILPSNLLPIAMGGRQVLTNAGVSNGLYPCTLPQDENGYYACAGDSQRAHHWVVDNGGARANWLLKWPKTNDSDVLNSGQPFASITPTIADLEMFEGNQASFLAWQYNSRLYQYSPNNTTFP
jgi:hypothetical protein